MESQTTSQIPPTQVEPLMKPVETKAKVSPMMIMFIVLVLLLAGVSAFLGYQNMQLQKQIVSLKTSSTPFATVDPTANWISYTRYADIFTFKYPKEAKPSEDNTASNIRFVYMGPKQVASGRTQTDLFDGYFFSIIKVGTLEQFDPKTEAVKQQQNSKETCSQVSDISEFKLNELNGFIFSCPNNYDLIYLTNSKDTYLITKFYAGDSLNSYKATTDQILSTFKFSNQVSDPTAGWREVISKYWSLKTPAGLHYILCEPDEGSFLLDPTLTADQKIECNFDGVRLISVGRSTSTYAIPTNPSVIPTADPNSPVGEASNLYTLVSETKNIVIGGKNAIYQKEDQHGGQGSGVYYKAYVVDGSITYVFSLSDVSKKDLFDQILSTFRFTK